MQHTVVRAPIGDKELVIETGAFLQSAEDVGNVVVGVFQGTPIYLRDVADIVVGAAWVDKDRFLGSLI